MRCPDCKGSMKVAFSGADHPFMKCVQCGATRPMGIENVIKRGDTK